MSAHDDLLVTRPSVAVAKRLTDGQDAHVQVGEAVSFDIVVTNDGTTAIDALPLSDVFDATYLRFDDATPYPDSEAPGTLDWDDLTGAGSLAVGETTTVTVEFTAIAHPPASSTTDTATVSGVIDVHGDPADDVRDTEPVGITAPSVRVRKVFSDTTRSVYQLGTPVSFDIGIENTGDTTITHLPLTDEFDPAMLQFASALPPADSVTSGTVGWADLTASLGDLAPGETATVTVTFTAVGVGDSVNAAVVADGTATDEHGDRVPGDRGELPFGVYSPDQIGFTKSANPPAGTILLPGDTITYSLAFSNTTTLAIPAVELVDQVPGSVTYRPGTMTIDRGDGTVVGLTDAVDGDEGVFDGAAGSRGTVIARMSEVPAETTVTVSFQVVVREAQYSRAGVRNYASATSAGDPVATVGPVDHYVDPIDITKTARDVNGGRLIAGDQIEWTIVVTNTGLVPTTNVVVRDKVPSQTIVCGQLDHRQRRRRLGCATARVERGHDAGRRIRDPYLPLAREVGAGVRHEHSQPSGRDRRSKPAEVLRLPRDPGGGRPHAAADRGQRLDLGLERARVASCRGCRVVVFAQAAPCVRLVQ